jgi:hypothetical protein
MMDVESLEQERGRRLGMMQTFTDTALGEHADRAAPAHLDLAAAGELLRKRGYEPVCRFGYVHVAADAQEWHVCLVGDLASMLPGQFLACLEESIKQSLQLTTVR